MKHLFASPFRFFGYSEDPAKAAAPRVLRGTVYSIDRAVGNGQAVTVTLESGLRERFEFPLECPPLHVNDDVGIMKVGDHVQALFNGTTDQTGWFPTKQALAGRNPGFRIEAALIGWLQAFVIAVIVVAVLWVLSGGDEGFGILQKVIQHAAFLCAGVWGSYCGFRAGLRDMRAWDRYLTFQRDFAALLSRGR